MSEGIISKSALANQNFQQGFNEARADVTEGLTYKVSATWVMEGITLNKREWTCSPADLIETLKKALEWAAMHLVHGPDTASTISVDHVLDVPGTEIVEAELVEEG